MSSSRKHKLTVDESSDTAVIPFKVLREGKLATHLDRSLFSLAKELKWKKVTAENLNLEYTILYPYKVATSLFEALERELEYFTGTLAKVKVFGKWHDIPRQQVTHGDFGLSYKYSGIITPARPWTPTLAKIRTQLLEVTGNYYNFVLVNKYRDGLDKMGEHKDDEKELDSETPIASLTLGQPRDFYFRHQDSRPPLKKQIKKVNICLEHGSLLLMRKPTNQFWYHALPPRKNILRPRINLTFRKIISK